MGTMRTPETQQKYKDYIASGAMDSVCPLCTMEEIRGFTHWKLIGNSFPYDKVALVQHMLVSRRHMPEHELSQEEKQEYIQIKESFINENYEFIFEATHKNMSIPAHFHLHLVVLQD